MTHNRRKFKYFGIIAAVLLGSLTAPIAGCAKVDKESRSKIVKIVGDMGMCSGEQVEAPSGVSYIVTAGHCKGLMGPDGFEITTEDGRHLKRRMIAESTTSDLILLEGVPGMKGFPIAKDSYPGQKIHTLSHGGNMNTYETKGELIQFDIISAPLYAVDTPAKEAECSAMRKTHVASDDFGGKVCMLTVGEIISTAMVVPGSSGGAVLNDNNELVGVVSAGRGEFSAFVTLYDIGMFLNNY